LISGNIPFKTEVVSLYIFGRIESGDPGGAAAASVVILGISFGVLLAIGVLRRWVTRHDREVRGALRVARLPGRPAGGSRRLCLLEDVPARIWTGLGPRADARCGSRSEGDADSHGDRRPG